MDICYVETPIGTAEIKGNEAGIKSISVIDNGPTSTDLIPESLQDCARQLQEYFQGERKTFNIQLNPEGTPFQKKVWKKLESIPYGKSMSYLELSKELGDVKAIRAVAAANGKNPHWIVVPCHRIIGSDGSLVGYAGGLGRKKWLLNHESSAKQQSLF